MILAFAKERIGFGELAIGRIIVIGHFFAVARFIEYLLVGDGVEICVSGISHWMSPSEQKSPNLRG
jgi:hypothetical protein